MPHLDPATLLLANLLVALTLVLMVMSTRVGLVGGASRGMRTWLAGDVLLLAGQASTALDALPGWALLAPPPLTVSSGCVTAGIAWHLMAIMRHRRPAGAVPLPAMFIAPFVGLFVGGASALMAEQSHRAMLFNVTLICMLSVTIVREMWPLRRFLGARIMIGAMGLAVLSNTLMLVSAATRPNAVPDGAVTGLLINMVMTMLTTSAFVLWLQEELRETLQHVAQTDALTGVLNRHGVLPQLQREVARAGRHGPALSLVLCDIDHFKQINDSHGHADGDAVLRAFAADLKHHARACDLVARWGGEEFLLVLPDTDAAGAKVVVDRLMARQAAAPAALHRVTFSAGVASTADPSARCDVDALLATADARLYAAKATRNTVVAA